MSRSSDVVRRPADSLGSTPILAVSRAFQDALDDGFSGVALVRSRGETVLHEAAGCASRELAIPNTVDTVFDIGSITKQYTAALVMALQEAGRLGVGDRLTDHFGDVPDDKADITIHQLLTHTAGLGDGFGADDVPIGLDVYLASCRYPQISRSPDELWHSAARQRTTSLARSLARSCALPDPHRPFVR